MSFGDAISGMQATPTPQQQYESLQNKLAQLGIDANKPQPQQAQLQQSPSFDELERFAGTMGVEKQEWVMNQRAVKEKNDIMRQGFNDWLFAQYYRQFDNWCSQNNEPCCKNYVQAYKDVANEYVSPIEQQNAQIAEQNKKIAELTSLLQQKTTGGELL